MIVYNILPDVFRLVCDEENPQLCHPALRVVRMGPKFLFFVPEIHQSGNINNINKHMKNMLFC